MCNNKQVVPGPEVDEAITEELREVIAAVETLADRPELRTVNISVIIARLMEIGAKL